MNYIRKVVYGIVLSCTTLTVNGQTKLPPGWTSSYVQITEDGKLTYHPDARGNTIPDFSRVGYHHGDKSIPVYPVVRTIAPGQRDDYREVIQQAIDEVSRLYPNADGHRGTILLQRGNYPVTETLRITVSGVVLQGEGDNVNETRLIAVGNEKRPLIEITGEGLPVEVPGTRVNITDEFVPVGAHSFRVSSARMYKPGDKIMLYRPGTQKWITAIRMDQIVEREGTRQWIPEEYNLAFEREIIRVEGDRVYIDNPVVMQMEPLYGSGSIYKYDFDGRISEVGIENLCLESEFDHYEDNQHGWIGIEVNKAENCWIKGVTARYFGYAGISLGENAKNVTVADCKTLESKSVITGGLRYSFNNNGQQNLFINCKATEGRHDYVTGARVCGPNVFYNCVATQTYADTGPHHRWAVGTLYDNIVTDGDINVQDRGQMGSGHGWSGVTQVLWNCRVRRAAVQSPWTSGDNYCFALKGERYPGHFKDRPEGVWEGHNEINVFPRSLYMAQLMARQPESDLTILTK